MHTPVPKIMNNTNMLSSATKPQLYGFCQKQIDMVKTCSCITLGINASHDYMDLTRKLKE